MQYTEVVYPDRTERFSTQKNQYKNNLKENCQKI